MAIVIYNGCAIIPGPMVTYRKNPIVAGNQRKIGTNYSITIEGTLVSAMGSPQGAGELTGSNWGGYLNKFWIGAGYPPNETVLYTNFLNNLLEKQEAIRQLFSNDGQWLEFQSQDGSTPMKCQIKDCDVDFPVGLWFNECSFTVQCVTDLMYVNGDPSQDAPFPDLIQAADEHWELQPAEVIKTFNVTHSVSAVGKRSFNSIGSEVQSPWENARDFVNNRLVLGWNGAAVYAPDSTANIFKASSLGSGTINFGGLSPYNFARVEAVDELGGSYAVTESWVAAVGSGTEVYNVNVNQIAEDPYTTILVGIQGVLKGFYVNLFDYDARMLSAEWMWSQLQGVPLYNRVSSYIGTSGIVLNEQPLAQILDYNPQEGTLTYNATFSNRLFNGDAFEVYTVSRKTSVEDYKSLFTINGQIKGRRYPGDGDQTVSFQRAYSLWNNLYANTSGANPNDATIFYNRIISNTYFPEAASIGLQISPIDRSIDYNQAEGIISYSFSFNNRFNPSGINNDTVEEDFSISSNFSRDDGLTHYNIGGSIKGLNTTDINPQLTKFQNASGYFYNYVQPNLYNRISSYYNISLPFNQPQSTEVSLQPIQGIITYAYSFTNMFPPLIAGALSEIITVSESNASGTVNSIATIPVIGRNNGPILQTLATTEVKTRQLSIETVLPPTGSLTDLLSAFNTRPNYDIYVAQVKPVNSYTTSDNTNYNWRIGHYSRNVSWIFE